MSAPDLSRLQHWTLSFGSSGHGWLTLDKAGAGSNTLSSDVLAELAIALDAIEAQPDLPGVVIRSGKPSGFIFGADVREFQQLEDPAEAARLAADGQALLQRLEELHCPTVALLNGYALGGGLELALACTYRVAIEGYDRCLGLPEIQLGIHPGFGGTVRAVEVMGAPRALGLILTGRSLSPKEARRAGLIDRLAPEGDAEAAALKLLKRRPPRARASWYLRMLRHPPLRGMVARKMRQQVARKAKAEHYPAPYAVVELWERHGGLGNAAFRAEAKSIGELLVSPSSKNLVRLFLLRERLRNLAPKRDDIRRLHVVGTGTMGGDIAAWSALKGLTVTLQDRKPEYVQPALERASGLFKKRLRAPGAAQAAMKRMIEDVPGERAADADVVIEAIIEDLEAKRSLFVELEKKVRPETILATNTSSIRLEDIGVGLDDPGRLVGLHFFNPVASMPLVEVIKTEQTDERILDLALAFVTQIGKLPLPCRSAPGFLVNRILMPYMLEALAAHQDGQAIETIDAAARDFGMPMGPIELADKVGLDVALHVARILAQTFNREPPQVLVDMVEEGRVGQKSDKGGFYRYQGGKPARRESYPPPDSKLVDRLILILVNEAAACFSDGVVEDPDLLDAGVVFGTGFAPFTGGPIQYARACGRQQLFERLEAQKAAHGPRFEPHPAWNDLLDNR
ncbi:MAG: 3-hydroxyacyl-CoA dehydrogenase NAD-binding domain-containing protein [Gammaproteobacteria bacterium]